MLENWDIELQMLIEQMCARDGDVNPCPEHIWRSAQEDMERVVSAQGCEWVNLDFI